MDGEAVFVLYKCANHGTKALVLLDGSATEGGTQLTNRKCCGAWTEYARFSVDIDALTDAVKDRIGVSQAQCDDLLDQIIDREQQRAAWEDKATEYKQQRDNEAWMHAACLTIAETGEKWGTSVTPSPAMLAVWTLRQDLGAATLRAEVAEAALARVREYAQRWIDTGLDAPPLRYCGDLILTAIGGDHE